MALIVEDIFEVLRGAEGVEVLEAHPVQNSASKIIE